ncbi:MAG: endonuclease/exonuclease/phosphatase family protein [Clostridia bacterium]|nr:endonuclease/exonuclease/phosphatase family protein [Clostridia bacterium]
MTFKKWMLVILAVALLLSCITGCKKAEVEQQEESAATEETVETEKEESAPKPTVPSKGPEVVQNDNDKTMTLPSQKEEESPEPEEEPMEEETPAPEEEEEEPEVTVEEGNQLKIVDYNVRCVDDGPNKLIEERAARFEVLMDRLDPDIMGLQEVTPRWLDYLTENFTDEYDYIHRWRAASSQEGTPVFWKKDKFKKLDSGYFWLSDTPSKESKADNWGAECYRICMWVKLRVKATGKDFLFFNTHFDFKNDTCHVNSAKVVITEAVKLKAFSKYAIFCTGDYNMGPKGKGYTAMYEKFADINADLNNDKSPTTNGYNEESGGGIIDYCFYSPKLVQPLKYQVLNEEINGGYISDHRGLYIEAALL